MQTDPDDTAQLKFALTTMGYYDNTKTGLSPYSDNYLFHSIKAFQKDNNLKVDGVINPDGPTQGKIKERLENDKKAGDAFEDFWRNYLDMREADFIDTFIAKPITRPLNVDGTVLQ